MKSNLQDLLADDISMESIASQKGFYYAIFISSILLSAILIVSFMTFVFRYGTQKGSLMGSNYELV